MFHILSWIIILATQYIQFCSSSTTIEQIIINHYKKAHGKEPTPKFVSSGTAKSTSHKTPTWNKIKPIDLSLPARANAYKIPIPYKDAIVQCLFYLNTPLSQRATRTWTIEIPRKDGKKWPQVSEGTSQVTVTEDIEHDGKPPIKVLYAKIEWIGAGPQISITDQKGTGKVPLSTVKFLGHFWMFMWDKLGVPVVSTQDDATFEDSSGQSIKGDAKFIRAFVGKKSVYNKKNGFHPLGPRGAGSAAEKASMQDVIEYLHSKVKTKDLEDYLKKQYADKMQADQKAGKLPSVQDALGNYDKLKSNIATLEKVKKALSIKDFTTPPFNNLGTVMGQLWYGKDTTYRVEDKWKKSPLWIPLFSMIKKWKVTKPYIDEIDRRNFKMQMDKPAWLKGGWPTGKKYKPKWKAKPSSSKPRKRSVSHSFEEAVNIFCELNEEKPTDDTPYKIVITKPKDQDTKVAQEEYINEYNDMQFMDESQYVYNGEILLLSILMAFGSICVCGICAVLGFFGGYLFSKVLNEKSETISETISVAEEI